MNFGEKLYNLRTKQGITQEMLARSLGVSRQAISRWELGEVVPDTANVLAVSRKFGVSVDYLLRDDDSDAADSLNINHTEESMKDRQYQVGSGMMWRFAALAGPAVWHLHRDDADGFLLAFALGWTLLFGILLARTMNKVRWLDEKSANYLLRNDLLAICLICFIPLVLRAIPGNWEIFLCQLMMVPILMKNWTCLRQVYRLPLRKTKSSKRHLF